MPGRTIGVAMTALVGMVLLSGSTNAIPRIEQLERDLASLSAAFNASVDKTRLVFVVGPTCPVCRKGLRDMKSQVLSALPENDELAILVVHVPALDAKESDVSEAAEILNDDRASHFWDEFGTSGIRFQRTLELPSYAWDVWMIYPPGARWIDRDPPAPAYWRHQLQGVDPSLRLDPVDFAVELSRILEAARTES